MLLRPRLTAADPGENGFEPVLRSVREDQLREVPPDSVALQPAVQPFGGGVPVGDLAVEVDGDDRFTDRLEQLGLALKLGLRPSLLGDVSSDQHVKAGLDGSDGVVLDLDRGAVPMTYAAAAPQRALVHQPRPVLVEAWQLVGREDVRDPHGDEVLGPVAGELAHGGVGSDQPARIVEQQERVLRVLEQSSKMGPA